MIAFGCPITNLDEYDLCASPALRQVVEPDSVVFAEPSVGSIFKSYNHLLDKAAELDGLEAMVLLHQDTELVDDDFCPRVRRAVRDPEVGVVGCVGAIGVRSIAWWQGSVTLASFLQRYKEHGGGEVPAFSWAWADAPPYARVGEVDTLDGFVLAVSPWAVRNLRFDESLGQLHGYDLDFCLQVREAGRKVMTADFRAVHHHSLMPFSDPGSWIEAHVKIADKWEGRIEGIGSGAGTWKQRALRAEAETDAAWLRNHRGLLETEARVRELRQGIDSARGSLSWRITAPLRLLNVVRRRPSGQPQLATSDPGGTRS
jgi:Glycosyltransferase like family